MNLRNQDQSGHQNRPALATPRPKRQVTEQIVEAVKQ